MPAFIEMEVFGEKQVSRELTRFGERAVEAEPAMHAIADRMKEQITEQFETEGSRGSGGWLPLKPTTIARKAALGQDTRILHATLLLRNTLTGEEGSAWEVGAESIEVSAGDAWYGVVHQKGSDVAKIPVRKPVDFTEIDRQEFVRILQEYLMGGEHA